MNKRNIQRYIGSMHKNSGKEINNYSTYIVNNQPRSPYNLTGVCKTGRWAAGEKNVQGFCCFTC